MKLVLALSCVLLVAASVQCLPQAGPPAGIPEENLSENCKTPKCPSNSENVILPYPLDCVLYIECIKSEPVVRVCPTDLVFNKATGKCDDKDKAKCVPCWQEPPKA